MKYPTREFLARKTRVLSAVLALAKLAGLRVDTRPDVLLPTQADYLYCPESDLIMAPWVHDDVGLPHRIEACARATYCDALMISLVSTHHGDESIHASVGLRRSDGFDWHHGLQVWTNHGASECWLLPPHNHNLPDEACFRLQPRRLRPITERPWSSPYEHGQGTGDAMARLNRLIKEGGVAAPGEVE